MVIVFFHLLCHPSLAQVRLELKENIDNGEPEVPELMKKTFARYHPAVYKAWKDNNFQQFLPPVTVMTVKSGKKIEKPGHSYQLFKYEHDY